MTVSSEDRRAGPFIQNGAIVSHPFTFKVFKTGDIQVFLRNTTTGVETQLAETTDYVVALLGDGDSGGTVTPTVARSSDFTLTVLRTVDLLQESDFSIEGGWNPEDYEDALDKQAMADQQLQASKERLLRVPETDEAISELPTAGLRAGGYQAYDANGQPVILPGTNVPIANGVLTVKDFGAVGDGVTDDAPAFALADATGAVVVPAGTYRLTGITLSGDVSFLPGSRIKPDNATTTTINGAVLADDSQYVFDISGGGSVGGLGNVQNASARWFGAAGDGVTDDTAEIAAALALTNTVLPSGTYLVDSFSVSASKTLTFQPGATIKVNNLETVNINGGLEAPSYSQIFDTSLGGTVAGFRKVLEVYPEWWGAIADDTTDSTAAIQEALDVGEATIVFQASSQAYRYNAATALFPKQGNNIIMDGAELHSLDPGTDSHECFRFNDGQNDIKLHGGTIRGFSGTTGVGRALRFSGAKRVTVEGTRTIDWRYDGVYIGAGAGLKSEDIKLLNCYVEDSDRNGITMVGNCSRVLIHGCTVDTVGTVNGDGIIIEPPGADLVTDVTISDCVIRDTNSYGIALRDSAGTVARVVIDNCIVINSGSDGVLAAGIRRLAISNCIIRDAADTGISIGIGTVSTSQWAVTGNQVYNPGLRGIQITAGDGVCDGNQFFQTGNRGAQIGGTSIVFTNNHIEDTNNAGIQIGNAENVVCNGNTIVRSQREGIYLKRAYNCTIHGNTIKGASLETDANWDCIELDDNSQNNSVQMNQCRVAELFASGTAQAGAASSITLATDSADNDDFYNGRRIVITGGTGSGQNKLIDDYDGATRVATVDSAWSTNPDGTSTYEIRELNQPAYGIRIQATADNNQVTNNDLRNSGTTGSFSDGASGTITTAGNAS